MKNYFLMLLMLGLGLLRTEPIFADTPTETASPSPTATETAVCGVTFGWTDLPGVGVSGFGSSVPVIVGSRFALPTNGTDQSISVYFANTTGNLNRAGIYFDQSGAIGNLIVQSNDYNTIDGWNTLPINPTYLISGNYWLISISQTYRMIYSYSTTQTASIESVRNGLNVVEYGQLPQTIPTTYVYPTGSTYYIYTSYCPGPPLFLTATPTITPSATPTITPLISGLGKTVLAPVPAKKGEPMCLYFSQPPSSSQWQIFNLAGQRVADLNFGQEPKQCWDTSALSPGVYLVHCQVTYISNQQESFTRKVAVVK